MIQIKLRKGKLMMIILIFKDQVDHEVLLEKPENAALLVQQDLQAKQDQMVNREVQDHLDLKDRKANVENLDLQDPQDNLEAPVREDLEDPQDQQDLWDLLEHLGSKVKQA